MSAIDDLPPLRDVVRTHGIDARKSLGQNFLYDLNLTSRIARTAGRLDGVTVVEIGPGAVLSGLLRRSLDGVTTARVASLEDLGLGSAA